MKRFRLWLLGLLVPAAAALGEEPTATEIVRRSDELWRGEQSYVEVTMIITRPAWTRTLRMRGWTQGTEKSLIRVLYPPKERGVGFLKRRREAWQYIPAIDRTIKIPPSMMLQSWLGSDFTNDDVVRADSLVVDYHHSLMDTVLDEGVAYWRIRARPKLRAPVVWGEVRFQIQQSNYVAKRVEYYDEDGTLVKYYETSDIRRIEGTEVATTLNMYDVSRPGHSTELTYEELTFDIEIEPGTFTLRNLEQ